MRRAIVAACAMATLLRPAPAQAAILDAIVPDAREHPVAAILVITILTDVYFVGSGIRYSIAHERPDRTWATVETVVAVPQAALGAVAAATSRDRYSLAFLGFGASLTTHGVVTLVQQRGSVDRRITPIESGLPFLAIDVPFLMVDAGHVFAGERTGRIAGVFETIVSAPQVAYGAYAAIAHPEDRWTVVAMTALPLTLLVHGVVEIALGAPSKDATAGIPERTAIDLRPTVRCRDSACTHFDTTLTMSGVF